MEEWLAQLEKLGRTETRVYFASLGSLACIHDMMGDTVQTYLATKRSRELTERLGSGHTLTAYVDFDREAGKLLELGRLADATALDAELVSRALADALAPSLRSELLLPLRAAAAEGALLSGDVALARETAQALDQQAAGQRLEGKATAWSGAAELVLAECDLASGDTSGARRHLASAREQLADSVAATSPWRIRAEKLAARLAGG